MMSQIINSGNFTEIYNSYNIIDSGNFTEINNSYKIVEAFK